MSEETSVPEGQVEEQALAEDGGEQAAEQAAAPASQKEQLQEVVETALANGASEKEVKSLIKEYQIKVNGKTKTVRADLSDDNFVKNQLQLAEAARISMEESSKLKKLYEQEVGRLKSDPWAILKELGMDPDELAEQRIQQRIEEMKKSPEQLERERIQLELQSHREEVKRMKEEREAENFTKLKQQAAIQIESEIEAALDAHKTLPKSRHIVKRIADSLLWAMDQGYEEATVEDVLPMVEKEWREEMGKLMDDSSEDILEQLIGQRNIERMRAKRLAGMTQQPKSSNSIKPTTASINKKEDTPREKLSQRAFFKGIGKSKTGN